MGKLTKKEIKTLLGNPSPNGITTDKGFVKPNKPELYSLDVWNNNTQLTEDLTIVDVAYDSESDFSTPTVDDLGKVWKAKDTKIMKKVIEDADNPGAYILEDFPKTGANGLVLDSDNGIITQEGEDVTEDVENTAGGMVLKIDSTKIKTGTIENTVRANINEGNVVALALRDGYIYGQYANNLTGDTIRFKKDGTYVCNSIGHIGEKIIDTGTAYYTYSNSNIISSIDFVTWNIVYTDSLHYFNDLLFDGEYFILVARSISSYDTLLYKTKDFLNIEIIDITSKIGKTGLVFIAYNQYDNYYLLNLGNDIYTSNDLDTWNLKQTNIPFRDILYTTKLGEKIVYVSKAGCIVEYPKNTWTRYNPPRSFLGIFDDKVFYTWYDSTIGRYVVGYTIDFVNFTSIYDYDSTIGYFYSSMYNDTLYAIKVQTISGNINDVTIKIDYLSSLIKQHGEDITDKIKQILSSSPIDISGKEDKSNKTSVITSSSTDAQYPSAQAVKDYVDGSLTETEQVSNRVTSIGAGSTDAQYPTAKAVYDLAAALDRLIPVTGTEYGETATTFTKHKYVWFGETDPGDTIKAQHMNTIFMVKE